MNKEELVEKLIAVSGYKRNAIGAIYGSIDLPGFQIVASSFESGPLQTGHSVRQEGQKSTLAERDTKKRFQKFKIDSLKGKTVLDIGSNTGAMAFEAYSKGADLVIGIDVVAPQVEVANDIAHYAAIDDKVRFFVFDVDTMTLDDLKSMVGCNLFDICFCLSLDLWVKDVQHLYDFMSKATKETLYFESNKRYRDIDKCTSELTSLGFTIVDYVGSCEDQAAAYAPDRLNFIAYKMTHGERNNV